MCARRRPVDLAAGYRWSTGRVVAAREYPLCLHDTGNGTGNGARAEFTKCAPSAAKQASAAQQWAFVPAASPDGIQTLRIHGKCQAVTSAANGSRLQLATCDGSARQAWSLEQGLGSLKSPASGRCLTDPGAEAPLEVYACVPDPQADNTEYLTRDWVLTTNGEIFNTDPNLCVADPGSPTAKGTRLVLEDGDGDGDEIWAVS
jgi:Ricin-type beta-trefoil lectin domain